MPGFAVSPLLIFQSVVNGIWEMLDSSCIPAWPSLSRRPLISAIGGKLVVMEDDSTTSGSSGQPHSVGHSDYPSAMHVDSKQILWQNVLRLMTERYGKENLTRLAADARVGPGTVTRIKDQQTSVGADVIDRIAAALKVQAWQLLMPDGVTTAEPSVSAFALSLAQMYDDLPVDRVLRQQIYHKVSNILLMRDALLSSQPTVSISPSPRVKKHNA